jgi:hypothetical protein
VNNQNKNDSLPGQSFKNEPEITGKRVFVLKKSTRKLQKFSRTSGNGPENVLLKSMGRDRAITGFAKRKTAEKYLV